MTGTFIHVTGTRSPWGRCACGHIWLIHDFQDYVGDDTDLCCADGCDQRGCPGTDPRRTWANEQHPFKRSALIELSLPDETNNHEETARS